MDMLKSCTLAKRISSVLQTEVILLASTDKKTYRWTIDATGTKGISYANKGKDTWYRLSVDKINNVLASGLDWNLCNVDELRGIITRFRGTIDKEFQYWFSQHKKVEAIETVVHSLIKGENR